MRYIKYFSIQIFFLLLLFSFSYSQEKRALDSREFKILLKAEKFTDSRNGAETIWKQIKTFAVSKGFKVSESDDAYSENIREIVFLDTKNLDFFKKNLIIRKRTKYSGSTLSSNYELTIKLRVDDLKDAESSDVSSRDGLDSKSKFEEDIGMSNDIVGSMRSVYSLSNSVKKLTFEQGIKVKDYCDIFPSLTKAGINQEEDIYTVNDIVIKEYVYEPGEIKFGAGMKVTAEITVWFKADETNPFIAEFSFKYKLGKKIISNESVKACEDFFKTLQPVLSESIHSGFTKTKMIYGKSE